MKYIGNMSEQEIDQLIKPRPKRIDLFNDPGIDIIPEDPGNKKFGIVDDTPPEGTPKGFRQVDSNGITREWSGSYWFVITQARLEREAHEKRENELVKMRAIPPKGADTKSMTKFDIFQLQPDGSERFMDSRGYRTTAMTYATSLLRACKKNPKVIRIKNSRSPYAIDIYWLPPETQEKNDD